MISVGVTGHRIIPEPALTTVVTRVSEIITALPEPVVGLTCLAIGADQIFARAVLAAGGDLVAVIPCERYEETFAPDELEEFRALLARARDVVRLPFVEPYEAAFMSAGEEVVRRSDVLIAVWDGQPAAGLGGTGDVVSLARDLDRTVEVVWKEGVRRDG